MNTRGRGASRKPLKRNSPSGFAEAWRVFRAFIIALLVLSASGYIVAFGLAYISFFHIDNVQIEGLETINEDQVRLYIDEYRESNVLALIPRRSSLFFNQDAIRNTLFNEFPQIRSIAIDLDTRENTITFTIAERKAVAVACDTAKEKNCLFINMYGMGYKHSPDWSSSVYDTFMIDADFSKATLPMRIFEKEELDSYQKFIKAVEQVFEDQDNFSISEIEFLERDIKLYTDAFGGDGLVPGSHLLFDQLAINDEIVRGQAFSDMRIAFEKADLFGRFEKAPEKFEALDVRFPEKLYVVFEVEGVGDEKVLTE